MAEHRTEGEEVGTYGVFVRNLVFYSRVKTVDVITDEQAQSLSGADRTAPSSCSRARSSSASSVSEGVTRAAASPSLSYFNQAGVRVGTLLSPDPARDLTQVVLVSNR